VATAPTILALEERRRQALLAGDLPALQDLLAEGLVYTHSTAAHDGKDSYLAKLEGGSLKYLALAFTDLRAHPLAQAAVVTGRMAATIAKEGQQRQVASLFMTVWAQDADGAWRLHAHQGTPLPAA
jgi:uncharacterized protein (TIGR02246 family)